ncbi:E3 ubiquitin-protein ligase RNF14-like [Lolium rigidum]|uniref:E3 ubiquitin-protein ligase RNF14-like n=1 Tax=Lolium rigidum TaxID=89674 RepID=UPI001F5CBD0A|nr:E3 ubiquitin-protein ligase RNF14-like [Lolium rigidum]
MESPHGEDDDLSPSPEAVRMLREMALREGEEPDLPDEQLRSNDQLQQDEMLALEAIYGDKIHIFDEKAGLRSFQIQVHCEIPDGISVCAESSQGVDDDDPSSKFLDNFSVEHLAPLSLTCLMPPSYPSHHPPYFTLGVQWLDNVKVSALCHMLDSIWAQQPGQEVIYEWVQWLQSSMLSHLGFDDRIVIRQLDDSMVGHVDVRVIEEILSVEDIVQHLISYNEEQCHESFIRGLHACMICFSEYTGVDFVKLPCQHYFCQRCMETYSRMHVNEGTVLQLVCPSDKCGCIIPPNLLKRLLGVADFERCERLMLQKALDSMADLVYCPRCGTACLEDEKKAQCSNCLFYFCTHCRDPCHIGRDCIILTPEEKLLTLQEREKVHRLSKGEVSMITTLANEIFSIREVLSSSVPCPRCGIDISRVSGCDHMHCKNCGKHFDYSLAKRNNVTALDFIEGAQKEPSVGLSVSVRQYPCPQCRKPHHKIGNNNHLVCAACQTRYCALCRKVVRKSSEHYGPRGCKQHTLDPEVAEAGTDNKDDSGSELSEMI